MGRRQRVEYAGAMYHVVQRRDNRESIFGQTAERDYLAGDICYSQGWAGFVNCNLLLDML